MKLSFQKLSIFMRIEKTLTRLTYVCTSTSEYLLFLKSFSFVPHLNVLQAQDESFAALQLETLPLMVNLTLNHTFKIVIGLLNRSPL